MQCHGDKAGVAWCRCKVGQVWHGAGEASVNLYGASGNGAQNLVRVGRCRCNGGGILGAGRGFGAFGKINMIHRDTMCVGAK